MPSQQFAGLIPEHPVKGRIGINNLPPGISHRHAFGHARQHPGLSLHGLGSPFPLGNVFAQAHEAPQLSLVVVERRRRDLTSKSEPSRRCCFSSTPTRLSPWSTRCNNAKDSSGLSEGDGRDHPTLYFRQGPAIDPL